MVWRGTPAILCALKSLLPQGKKDVLLYVCLSVSWFYLLCLDIYSIVYVCVCGVQLYFFYPGLPALYPL